MFILKEVNYFCKTFKLNSSDLKGLVLKFLSDLPIHDGNFLRFIWPKKGKVLAFSTGCPNKLVDWDTL